MRLKSVWISEYKNLRDFSITFEGDSFLDIFVGKNGTGKSNFFEAVIEIFNFIFSSKKKRSSIGFDFDISYEIDGQDIRISSKEGQMEVDGVKRATIGNIPIPDNVIIYYSGHSDTIGKTVESYAKSYARRNKSWTGKEAREFISIGNEYKEMLLSILLLQAENCAARQYVCSKLGIEVSTETVTLTLRPPKFKHSDVEVGDVASFLWGATGTSLAFVERLLECVRGDFSRDSIYDRSKDRYEIEINRALFAEKFEDETSSDLFRNLDNLKTLGMFETLAIPIGLADGRPLQVRDFSDGQFQSVYIYAISELFKDRNCITLLDEPDSFLHPEWQFSFLEQVVDIAGTVAAETNHVLLSSHSAATLISHDRDSIGFFDLRDGNAHAYRVPKRVAVQKLSEKLIKYTESEQLLSIINAIQFKARPILFTEGSIDPIIIKEAWNRLFDYEMPFVPFYGFSCSYLKQLIQDPRIHNEMDGLPVFGLFDFDKAFDQWNRLNDVMEQDDLEKGQVKKVANQNAFGIMLPLPENQRIRDQVVSNLETNLSFGGDSLCEIEHLFYGDPLTDDFFCEEVAPGGGRKIVIKSDAKKQDFAQDIIPQLDDKYFLVFKPVFDFICSKI